VGASFGIFPEAIGAAAFLYSGPTGSLAITDNDGSEVDLSLQSFPVSNGSNMIQPGKSTFFQYWYRIQGGGSRLSNSLEMVCAP
jgi:hypothetical protein